eukprot:CAMPEP_0117428516 /NCGR_PEP_ID=MMETSP0758-20121206/8203_1 /TAXON_ID=63605 /ORGANISM="Percolomonas cosmopolitus, Strain AE-1 (ATCC 50343)" /LENGTH=594 /DNA_ID=CAMNT_0005214909 /DNA_START=433 /DNA_END=2213 /DNA_ORIENTATION=+
MEMKDNILETFKLKVINLIKNNLHGNIIDNIEAERLGETIDRKLIHDTTVMLNDMKCYEETLEKFLLKRTTTFYKEEAAKLTEHQSVTKYLEIVKRRLDEEMDRVECYLMSSTAQSLEKIVRVEMITTYLNFILENSKEGFIPLIRENDVNHLEMMFHLVNHDESHLKKMIERYQAHILETGKKYIMLEDNLKNPISFIDGLLSLKKKFDIITSKSFKNKQGFVKAMNNGFTGFSDGSLQKSIAEYLSLYLDTAMKMENKDDEFEPTLKRALSIFKYLQDKDVFENYYKNHLSQRLIQSSNRSNPNFVHEKKFVDLLQKECGHNFVSKLDGMFNDLKLSALSMENFHKSDAYKKNVEEQGMTFNVQVLTSSFWPAYPISKTIFPAPMVDATKAFEAYYDSKHPRRSIMWQKNLGDGVILARFPLSKHEIFVSTQQMTILSLFNSNNSLTLEDILNQTNMNLKQAKIALMLLFLGKHKILKKEPSTKKLDKKDVFSWNASFKSTEPFIKFSSVSSKDGKDGSNESSKPASLESLIIGSFKNHKKIIYKDLVVQMKKDMGKDFPGKEEVKRIVESFIEKEYLVRDEDNRRNLIWTG